MESARFPGHWTTGGRSTNETYPAFQVEDFRRRLSELLDGKDVRRLSDDELPKFLGLVQQAFDLLLCYYERRGLLELDDGAPIVSFAVPAGIELVDTVLTRGPERPGPASAH